WHLGEPIFQTHYISNADQSAMTSIFYEEAASAGEPLAEVEISWKEKSDKDPNEFITQPEGTWVSTDYAFAIEDHDGEYDTIRNVSTKLILKETGTYEKVINGTVWTAGSPTEFNRKERGKWNYKSEGRYISFYPENGSPYQAAISNVRENSLVLSLVIKGYIDEQMISFKNLAFSKESGACISS
ncbi:MAG: hypothetical protein P8X57_15445, partial [Cyclobacteriaceae bacterium]